MTYGVTIQGGEVPTRRGPYHGSLVDFLRRERSSSSGRTQNNPWDSFYNKPLRVAMPLGHNGDHRKDVEPEFAISGNACLSRR